MEATDKLKQDEADYRRKLYDFIPVNSQLIDHVRRLDGFSDDELAELGTLLTDTVQRVN